jgi:endonuclease YncB( thermonuclease family)
MDKGLARHHGAVLVLWALGWLWAFPAEGRAVTAKVTGVDSGSQVLVFLDSKVERIELYGVHSPKSGKPGHRQPRDFTTDRVFGKVVELEFIKREGEALRHALLRVDGALLNEELVRQGLAWVHPHLCRLPACEQWKGLEDEAREASRGLWANAKAFPPWDERRTRQRKR